MTECQSLFDFENILKEAESELVQLDSCKNQKFGQLYSSAQVRHGLSDFYNGKHGLMEGYLDWWEYMAEYFENNEFVLGYDIFNEAYPATLQMEETFDQTTEEFDMHVLQPMYKKIAARIRDEDPNKLIFFQPSRIPDILPKMEGNILNTSIDTVPGGRKHI